jgi:hypothetical protein
MRAWLIAGGGVLLLGIAILVGVSYYRSSTPPPAGPIKSQGPSALDVAQSDPNVTTVDLPVGQDPSRGATPMAQRVAVIGLLNKRNGVSRDLTMKPGQAIRVGDVVVRLRACEQTAPWEAEHYTGAFVQVDVQQVNKSWQRVFSGWLFKERPALNVVQHPVYDVWTKSCAMSFPGAAPSDDEPAKPSIAKKSAPEAPAENATAPALPAPVLPSPTTPTSADDNRDR